MLSMTTNRLASHPDHITHHTLQPPRRRTNVPLSARPARQLDASAHPGSAPTSSAGTTPPSSRPHSRREDPPSLPPPLLVLCAAERAKLQSFKGYARARDFFRGMCNAGQQFPRGTTVFINLGSAMAYMCNYDVDNRCWRQV
ncbi:hypothetical protein MCOR02_004915 [Pyricularia oryzae]|nr:hypothetical protein MCOR02_004915 [Pyricularia oryzae]KAI6289359.1 hypothetical protein MCOR34_010758 [Pyricularia oryzae]KAI6643646.1 hypothetical protein MCOR14_001876 [Pyricularia oryzae]